MDKDGGHCRIDASRKGADGFSFPHLLFNFFDAFSHKVSWRPVALAATYFVYEILKYRFPYCSVDYFRMELKAKDALIITHNSNWRVISIGQSLEVRRSSQYLVTMAHPYGKGGGKAGKKGTIFSIQI